MSKPVRPEWLYGPETPRNSRTRFIISGVVIALAALCLVILTGCKSEGTPTPNPNHVAAQSAPVKAPQVPGTAGTSVSVTIYDSGTVVPVDVTKLPHPDCWFEINLMDADQQPGGTKVVEVKAICP